MSEIDHYVSNGTKVLQMMQWSLHIKFIIFTLFMF